MLRAEITEPPARHQRRILITATEVISEGSSSALAKSCLHWQQQYIGGLFLAIDERDSDDRGALIVQKLLKLGLSPHSVIFFPVGVVEPWPGLTDLLGQALPRAAVEILTVGATDVGGYPDDALITAAEQAQKINAHLGRAELPIPRRLDNRAPAPAAQAGPEPPCTASSEIGSTLLAEGERRIRRETEQRAELFAELVAYA